MTTTPNTTSPAAGTDRAEFSEEDTAIVTRPTAATQAPQGYGPGPSGAPQGYGHGYGPAGVPPFGGHGPGFPPPPYGPQHTVTGFPGAQKRGLAAVPRAAWLAAAGAVALVVILVAVIVAGHNSGGGSAPQATGRSTSGATTVAAEDDPAKLITSAQLPGMLLNPTEMAQAVGQPDNIAGIKPAEIRTTPYIDELVAGKQCLPVAYAAEKVAYQGSGFTAMRALSTAMRTPNDDARSWLFYQSLFAYPSADAAEKALLTNIGLWKACEGKSYSYMDSGREVFWSIGAVQQIDTMVIVPTTQENGDGWGCWRGITVTGNVVADFATCGKDQPQTAITNAAASITAKSPTA